MIQSVPIREAQTHLFELIDAALKGRTVVIARDERQAVQLVPLATAGYRQYGSAQGLVTMADDFDAPLADFADYSA